MAINSLKQGGVGVIPTDTLYGLVARAEDKQTVAKVKRLKKRSVGKPFIILISSLKDLEKFNLPAGRQGIKLGPEDKKILTKIWPGPVSVALSAKFSFRWPKNKFLLELIKKTGPLVAPSANPEGLAPASTIKEAKKYFQGRVNFYLSAGRKLTGQASTLISLKNGKIKILRYGKYKLRGIQ